VDKVKRAKEGIGIITSQELEQKVTAWDLVNSRIINIDLDLEEKLTVVQIYAPISDARIAEIETFSDTLQSIVDKARDKSHHVIVMGDWNS
jgi:exonuclease III